MEPLLATRIDSFWAQACSFFGSKEVRHLVGSDLQPRLLGRVLSRVGLPRPTEDLLHIIPSETTELERRFLFAYSAILWSGRHPALEIGPFLGGTTRALALGMRANPERRPGAQLFTFDRFMRYHTQDSLKTQVLPLIERGVLPASVLGGLGAQASFREIFEMLHETTTYAEDLVVSEGWLADSREKERTLRSAFAPPPGLRFDLVFVDGCKSWYGTKMFLRKLAPALVPGASLIFQDYAWHTCYWIPAFVHALRDHLRLVAHIDATYAFELVETFDPDRVEAILPDSIQAWNGEAVSTLFAQIIDLANERGDLDARVIHCLQEVAALLDLGDATTARERARHIASGRWSSKSAASIVAAFRRWRI